MAKSTKLIIVGIVLGALACGTAFAAGPFGPVDPISKSTEPLSGSSGWSLSVGYWYYQDKFKIKDPLSIDYNVKSNQVYLQAAKKAGGGEIYARLGGATFEGTYDSLNAKMSDSMKPFGALGLRYYFPLGSGFGVGPLVQGTYYFSEYKDTISVAGLSGVEIKQKDYWDASIGLGFQYSADMFRIYAGPFAYWAQAKFDGTAPPGYWWASTGTQNISINTENKSNIGGFAGIVFDFTKQFSLSVEGTYSQDFSGGAMLNYSF
jgi:hypothetical protein